MPKPSALNYVPFRSAGRAFALFCLVAMAFSFSRLGAAQVDSPALTTASPAVGGPHVLYLQQLKLWRLVVDVERQDPFLMIDGKREPATSGLRDFVDPTVASEFGNGYKLQPASFFYPAIVKVDNLAIRGLSQQVSSVNRLSKSLAFRANFTSPVTIDHVYVALEAISKSDNHRFFLHELGRLEANRSKALSEDHMFEIGYEPLTYKFYLFTSGLEIMTTEMPAAEIEQGLSQLISRQIAHAPSDRPTMLISPQPKYPEELLEKKVTGQAVLTFHVTTDGRVENAQVAQSSNPAFNAPALEAVRSWRFVPAVKQGKRIASSVSLPFDFSP